MKQKLYDVIIESIGDKRLPSTLDSDIKRLSDQLGSDRKSVEEVDEIVEQYSSIRARIKDAVGIKTAQEFDLFIRNLKK